MKIFTRKNLKYLFGVPLIGLLGLYISYISIRPIITFRSNKAEGKTSGITLNNNGNGSALIDSITFTLDGKIFNSGTIEDWQNIVFMTDNLGHNWLTFQRVKPGSYIKNGEEMYLFYTDNYDSEKHRQLMCLINNLEIEIKYKDSIGLKHEAKYIPDNDDIAYRDMDCSFFHK